jgi:acetylornithine deacetylase/succinyl-diaminopimelate desuccinylase-like protein
MSKIINSYAETINNIIGSNRDEIIKFALECVKIPSETPPGDETLIADFIIKKANLWDLGSPQIIAKNKNRPSLIFNIKGTRKGKKLIFSAHMDTKPIGDILSWKSINPNMPQIREGKLYGRGSTDMKGALAGMLAAAYAIKISNISFSGELSLLFTADEEGGSNFGAKYIAKKGLEADAIVIGEPSGEEKNFDNISLACRGSLVGKIVVHGTQMHSSISDRGGCINPSIEMAKVLLEFADNLKDNLRYKNHWLYPLGPTINPGVLLEGGVFYGIIPGVVSFGFDIRVLPGMTFEKLKNDIEKFLTYLMEKNKNLDAKLVFEKPPMIIWTPPAEIDENHPIVESCISSTKKILGYEPKKVGAPFTTEAGFFDSYLNIPTISSFGPGFIKLAHGPDEFVEVQAIIDSAKIYALAALDYLNK